MSSRAERRVGTGLRALGTHWSHPSQYASCVFLGINAGNSSRRRASSFCHFKAFLGLPDQTAEPAICGKFDAKSRELIADGRAAADRETIGDIALALPSVADQEACRNGP